MPSSRQGTKTTHVHEMKFRHQDLFRQKWITFISMFIGWFFYYICRRTFSSTMPLLITENGFTKNDLGTISSSFSASYAVSKFMSAVLSDHSNPRYLLTIGLCLSGLTTLVFPLSSSILYCSVVLFIQGVVQGFGWPAIAKMLKAWFPPESIGTWWSILSCSGSVAAAVSPLLIAHLIKITEWYNIYYLVGCTSIVLAIVLYFIISESPRDSKNQTSPISSKSNDTSLKQILYYRELWIVSFIYCLLYLMKYSVTDWGQLYFMQHIGYQQTTAAGCVGMVMFGGVVGNAVWGYLSDVLTDKLPKGSRTPRAPALLLSAMLSMLFLHLFVFFIYEGVSEVRTSFLCFLVGLAIDGGVAVVGLAAMDAVPDQLSGSAHGLACAFGQGGTLLAGYPFSVLVKYGWTTAYEIIELISVVMIGLCSYLIFIGFRKEKKLIE